MSDGGAVGVDSADGGQQDIPDPALHKRRESQSAIQHVMAYNTGLMESQSNPDAPPPVPPKRKHSTTHLHHFLYSLFHPIAVQYMHLQHRVC